MSDVNEILGVEGKTNGNVQISNSENQIGNTLKMIGKWTLILGIIIGLLVGIFSTTPDLEYSSLTEPNPLRWVYGGAIIISSFVSGFTFLGFGEIIMLLDGIKKNTSKIGK